MQLGEEQLAHVRGHFDRVDVDGKGEIPVADLAPTLSAVRRERIGEAFALTTVLFCLLLVLFLLWW